MGYSKHVYDIDIIGILNTIISPPWRNKIKFRSDEMHLEFIRMMEGAAYDYFKWNQTKLKNQLLKNAPKILKPNQNDWRYTFWMATFLSIQDPDIIPLILIHHWEKVNYENWFLDHLQHKVIPALPSDKFIDIRKHKVKIVKWVEKQIKNKKYSKTTSAHKSSSNNSRVHAHLISSQYPAIKIESFALENIYQVLADYVDDDSNRKDFKKILSGQKNKEPIKLKCQCNFFVKTFLYLRTEKKVSFIDPDLPFWICTNFKFYNDKLKSYASPDGEYVRKLFSSTKRLGKKAQIEFDQKIKSI